MYEFKTQKSKFAGRRQTKVLKSFNEVKVTSASCKNTNFKTVPEELLRMRICKVAEI